MKKLLSILFLLFCLRAESQTNINVTYQFIDFTTLPVNLVSLSLSPLPAYGIYNTNLALPDTVYASLTNGQTSYTFTNVLSGFLYKVTGNTLAGSHSLTNYFFTNITSGTTVNGNQYIVPFLTPTIIYVIASTGGSGNDPNALHATNNLGDVISPTASLANIGGINAAYALTLSTNSTNYSLTLSTNSTNYALALSVSATNYALLIGQNGTNYGLLLSTNSTNWSLLLSTNGTNFTLSIGASVTNLANAIGLASTNLAQSLATNGTNFTLLISTNATNFTLAQGTAITNFILSLGTTITNKFVQTNDSRAVAFTNVGSSFSGNGNALIINPTNLSGNLQTANFNGATNASSSTFWRGDGTWGSVSAGGTVTSVAMTGDGTLFNSSVTGSPITAGGTFLPTLKTQSANTILAGPILGSPGEPAFRTLIGSDMPSTVASLTNTAEQTFAGNVAAPLFDGPANALTQTFNLDDISVTASGGWVDFTAFSNGIKAGTFQGALPATNLVDGPVPSGLLTAGNTNLAGHLLAVGVPSAGVTNRYITYNGSALTNLLGGFTTNSVSQSFPNTNVVVISGAGTTAANQTYTWSSVSNVYAGATAGWYIYLDGGDAVISDAGDDMYVTDFGQLGQEGYLQLDWSNNRLDGSLPNPIGALQLVSTNLPSFTQSSPANSSFDLLFSTNANFGLGNQLTTQYPATPGFVSGFDNCEFGQTSAIAGGSFNTNYGGSDFIGGGHNNVIVNSFGSDSFIACEYSSMSNSAGVSASVASTHMTNNATQNGVIMCVEGNGLLDHGSIDFAMIGGGADKSFGGRMYALAISGMCGGVASTNIGQNLFSYGFFSTINDATNSVTLGTSNSVSDANQVCLLGTGLTSTGEIGVTRVGVTGSQIAFSGTNAQVTGSLTLAALTITNGTISKSTSVTYFSAANYTNTSGYDQFVSYDFTSGTVTNFFASGTAYFTNATAITGNESAALAPGDYLHASATMTGYGRVIP